MSRRAIRDMNGNSNRGADPLYGIHTDISDMETTQTRRLKHHLGHCLAHPRAEANLDAHFYEKSLLAVVYLPRDVSGEADPAARRRFLRRPVDPPQGQGQGEEFFKGQDLSRRKTGQGKDLLVEERRLWGSAGI